MSMNDEDKTMFAMRISRKENPHCQIKCNIPDPSLNIGLVNQSLARYPSLIYNLGFYVVVG